MDAPQGAENDDTPGGPEFPTQSQLVTLATASRQDRLGYIADLVQELKIMAAQADCHTLASLLETAYREALRQGQAGA